MLNGIIGFALGTICMLIVAVYQGQDTPTTTLEQDANHVALVSVCSTAKILPVKRYNDVMDAAIVSHGERVFIPAFLDATERLGKRSTKAVQLVCHEL